MASRTWKTHLDSQLPKAMADEINVFETELELRQKGKLEEKLFAETRLRRGVYGQRYDNGLRHDGEAQQLYEEIYRFYKDDATFLRELSSLAAARGLIDRQIETLNSIVALKQANTA